MSEERIITAAPITTGEKNGGKQSETLIEKSIESGVRYRTGKRAKVHFDLVTLIYNASKLAVDRMNAVLNQQAA